MYSIDESYGFLLAKIAQSIADGMRAELTAREIDEKHFGTLLVVYEHPMITQLEAGEKQRIDRTTIGKIIAKLCEIGYVDRTQHPDDGRAYGLRLTKRGEKQLELLWQCKLQSEQQVFAKLGDEECEAFLSSVKKTAGVING